MTNGEKLKEVFPSIQITECESYVQVMGKNFEFNNTYPKKWWNSEYEEPKIGHWIYDDEYHEHGHCSRCGYGSVDLVDGEPHNFCRNCGAKMEVEEVKNANN